MCVVGSLQMLQKVTQIELVSHEPLLEKFVHGQIENIFLLRQHPTPRIS